MNRASLDKDPRDVARMFDAVADKYDRANDLFTFFQARRWRREVFAAAEVNAQSKVLDVGAGTGTSSEPFVDAGAEVIACDFSRGMLEVGRRRRPDITFIEADATALPFEDNSFDVTTISYALRNVNQPELALAEMYRVTRPGGRIVVCELSRPQNPYWRAVYLQALLHVVPALAPMVTSNPEAYSYLGESIAAWPDQDQLAAMLSEAGFTDVRYKNLTTGIVALHRGFKPTTAS